MLPWRYIVVEGVIGVGKTSLVKLLATASGGRVNLEVVEENPFLPGFYQDRKKHAFQAQLFFLLSRYRQLQELAQRDLFHQVTLCDYIFPKDKIFAYLNLDDSELLIYDKLYAMLEEQVEQSAGRQRRLEGQRGVEVEALLANLAALTDEIVRARPASAKGRFIRNMAVSSTMGPGSLPMRGIYMARGSPGKRIQTVFPPSLSTTPIRAAEIVSPTFG